jgi:hypothetical protein
MYMRRAGLSWETITKITGHREENDNVKAVEEAMNKMEIATMQKDKGTEDNGKAVEEAVDKEDMEEVE